MTTTKQEARARLARVAAERAAQQKLNVEDLAQFIAEVGKIGELDVWVEKQIEKARRVASGRRRRHEVEAGKALAAVRARGESVESIARQLEIPAAKVREFLKLAAEVPAVNGAELES